MAACSAGRVQDVALDQLAPAHHVAPAAVQVVVDHHAPALRGERLAAVAADIAGAAGDEDGLHAHSPEPARLWRQLRTGSRLCSPQAPCRRLQGGGCQRLFLHALSAVTVVIVAYDSGGYLQPCVDALAAQSFADFEAVVADNASRDALGGRRCACPTRGSPARHGRQPRASPRPTTGWREASRRRVPGPAEPRRHARSGLARGPGRGRPRLPRRPPASARCSCGWRSRTSWTASATSGTWPGWPGARAKAGPRRERPATGRSSPPAARRRCTARQAFLDAGGFDERFFCYCEDVDLGHRLRAGGASSRRVSAAVVRHAGSGISGRTSDFTMFHGHRNRIWTFVKNTPGAWFWLLAPYHIAFNLLYLGSAVRRRVFRPVWRSYVAAVMGLAPFLVDRRRLAGRRRTPFKATLEVMASTPWSPFRRELHPR